MSRASQDARGVTRVQVLPDWTDPSGRRWQVLVGEEGREFVTCYPSEADARGAAFWLTGVGDFLDDLTWVNGSGFRTPLAA